MDWGKEMRLVLENVMWPSLCELQGVLLSGPPGTGKTLFARTLAKESGLPFVFASGAEFTDSEKSGAARINEMFSIARRNVSILLFPFSFFIWILCSARNLEGKPRSFYQARKLNCLELKLVNLHNGEAVVNPSPFSILYSPSLFLSFLFNVFFTNVPTY